MKSVDFSVFDEIVADNGDQDATEDWNAFEAAVTPTEIDLISLDSPEVVPASSRDADITRSVLDDVIKPFSLVLEEDLISSDAVGGTAQPVVRPSSSSEDILSLFNSPPTFSAMSLSTTSDDVSPSPAFLQFLPPLSVEHAADLAFFQSTNAGNIAAAADAVDDDDDDFGDFESADFEDPTKRAETIVAKINEQNPLKIYDAACAQAAYTAEELLVLSHALTALFHYEDALLCLRQHALVAMISKGGGNVASMKVLLCPQVAEASWQQLVASQTLGVSVDEMIDLLSMINENSSAVFSSEVTSYNATTEKKLEKSLESYLASLQVSGEVAFLGVFRNKELRSPLLFQCLFQLTLKRRLRCAVALCTSHNDVKRGWEPLLLASLKFSEGSRAISQNFLTLSAVDQV